jgi:molybdate transport system regulatory protein
MVRLTIRIDLAGGSVGPGKIGLLEQVAATGSIRKAAAAMKMSYRRAWLLLQALEACFGSPLVETATGGNWSKPPRVGRRVAERG